MSLLEEAFWGAGWDESEHPRDPGGEGGGQFIPKNTTAVNEEEAGAHIRLPKFAEAKALQDRLYEIGIDDDLGRWALEDWGEWTDDQMRELKAYLDKHLYEGGWVEHVVKDENGDVVYGPDGNAQTKQTWRSSGLLSVAYSKEIGMSYAGERRQARSLAAALEKHIAYNEAIRHGFDPADYAADLFGEEAVAARRKPKNIAPRDQGIPEDYLTERGTFKPGFDAKLKSDLVNSYFELHPQKMAPGVVSAETKKAAIADWKERNPDRLMNHTENRPWTDAELEGIALRDYLGLSADIGRQVKLESAPTLRSTLIHRFEPQEALRILEERGWTKFLDQKREKMRGMLERDPATADKFIPGYAAALQSELAAVREHWGPAIDIKGERFGLVQMQLEELAHLGPNTAKRLADNGVRIYVGPGASTDLDEMWHLSDERARGWGNTYLSRVGGFYSPSSRSVIVSATAPSSTRGLATHEIGHAIGDVLGIDDHPELAVHHRKVYNQLRKYFKQGGQGGYAGRQELWAEGVSAVLVNRMNKSFDRQVSRGKLDTGPFLENDYDALSPEAKDYLDWVERTLDEIERGQHVAS